METTSRLDGSHPFQKSARRCPSAFVREKIGGYVVLGALFSSFLPSRSSAYPCIIINTECPHDFLVWLAYFLS